MLMLIWVHFLSLFLIILASANEKTSLSLAETLLKQRNVPEQRLVGFIQT